ncbi:lipocalin family protein, partial [Halomonas sp. BBD48]|nr:lipocalin family protein [Halomonas sp. BBD48]
VAARATAARWGAARPGRQRAWPARASWRSGPGSWITPQGEVTALDEESLRLTPVETRDVAGRELPTTWRVEVPARGLAVTVSAIHADQWMGTSFPYWEGMVTVQGSHTGEGYLEMTGY